GLGFWVVHPAGFEPAATGSEESSVVPAVSRSYRLLPACPHRYGRFFRPVPPPAVQACYSRAAAERTRDGASRRSGSPLRREGRRPSQRSILVGVGRQRHHSSGGGLRGAWEPSLPMESRGGSQA